MITTVSIPGIHCDACSALIKDVSSEFPDIQSVDVNTDTKIVTINHADTLDMEKWKDEIQSLDEKYTILPAKS